MYAGFDAMQGTMPLKKHLKIPVDNESIWRGEHFIYSEPAKLLIRDNFKHNSLLVLWELYIMYPNPIHFWVLQYSPSTLITPPKKIKK